MIRKNLKGTLRSGILMTAAAAMLVANVTAFAAEDDAEEPAGIFWQEDVISGTVTEVGNGSITVKVSGMMQDNGFAMGMPQGERPEGMPEGGQGMGMPNGQGMGMPNGQGMGMPDGQTPPELPDGQTPPELPDGQTPPELPDGVDALMGGQRPEGMPEGERPEGMPQDGQRPEGMPEGERPEGMPQGGQMPEGGRGMGMPGGQLDMDVVVNVDSDTVIIKGSDENADLSDVTVGSTVMVMLDGDKAVSILVLN